MYLFKKLIQRISCLVLSVSMMEVGLEATIVLIMIDSPENVVWSVVAFLPVPIFFLSYSPLSSAVLRTLQRMVQIFYSGLGSSHCGYAALLCPRFNYRTSFQSIALDRERGYTNS